MFALKTFSLIQICLRKHDSKSSSYVHQQQQPHQSHPEEQKSDQQQHSDVSLLIQNYMNLSGEEEPSDVKNASKETYVLGDSVGAIDILEGDLATPEMQVISEEEEIVEEVIEKIIETQEVIVQEEIEEIITETRLISGASSTQSTGEEGEEAKGKT